MRSRQLLAFRRPGAMRRAVSVTPVTASVSPWGSMRDYVR